MANIILTVDGQTIPIEPSKCTYSLKDISASDAGRTEDTAMQKKRLGQAWTIQLEWSGLTHTQITALGRLFNNEYLQINYYDYMEQGYVTSEFYKGDSTSPVYNSTMGLWTNLSFNLIQRKARVFDSTHNRWEAENSYSISTSVTHGTAVGATRISDLATIIITPDTGYSLPTTITVNGVTGTSGTTGATWTYNATTGIISLSNPANQITISVSCVSQELYDYDVEDNTLFIRKAPYVLSDNTLQIT